MLVDGLSRLPAVDLDTQFQLAFVNLLNRLNVSVEFVVDLSSEQRELKKSG